MARRPDPHRRHHTADGDERDDPRAADWREALSTSESGTPGSLVVGLDCRSMNLYRFLRVRFPAQPHGELRRWIGERLVTVNGEAVDDSRPLRFGDVVEIDADVTRVRRGAAPPRLAVLHADAALVAIDKPAGLATAGERNVKQANLLALLRKQRPADAPKLVHRIDKHASGVVVFAFGREAKAALTAEFAARRVVKDYLALVSGHVDDAPQEIDAPLSPRLGRVERMVVTPGRGKPAVTLVRALLRFRGYTLVHARPLTGRTHQIRAHLRHLGHSLVGDPLYDGEEALLLSALKHGYRPGRGEAERPLLARLALHAAAIRLRSPASGPLHVQAPLPKDLRSALKQLHKSAAVRRVADFERFLDAPLGPPLAADPFEPLMAPALARLAAPPPAAGAD